MKTEKIIIEGLGGQGVQSAGRFLGQMAMRSNFCASFSPAYGAEVRGGVSHCEVVISREPVKSFLVEVPTLGMIISQQAWSSLAPKCLAGSRILINSSLVKPDNYTGPARLARVPASRIADEIGNPLVANTVMIGAFVGVSGLFSMKELEQALNEVLAGRHSATIPDNIEAARRGRELMQI